MLVFIRVLSFIFAALLTSNAFAVYKCTVNGKTVYSDIKCAEDASVVDTSKSKSPSRALPGSDYLTPAERSMLKNYEDRKPKRTSQQSSGGSIYGPNSNSCKSAKMYHEDYQDELRSGCTVSRCEKVKKELRYWKRRVDRYCK